MLRSLYIKTPILRFRHLFVYGINYPLVGWKALDSVGLALNLVGQDDVSQYCNTLATEKYGERFIYLILVTRTQLTPAQCSRL